MRKITIGLLLSTFVLTSCARYGRLIADAPNNCGMVGHGISNIVYGDARIAVTADVMLANDAEFRVKLTPTGPNGPGTPTNQLEVTVEGDLANDPNSGWITPRTASYEDVQANRGFMPPLCVPPGQAPREYNYKITVSNVGVLDPRARVR